MNETVPEEGNIYFEMESNTSETGIYDEVPREIINPTVKQRAFEKLLKKRHLSTESIECRSQSDMMIVQRMMCIMIALVVVSFLTAAATLAIALTMMLSRNTSTASTERAAVQELRDTSTPSRATLREFSTNVQELRMDMMSFIRENSENTTALWKAMQFYTEEVIQLDQKVINISKMQGPRGPPGYNGTQGPAGVSGPPGPPGFNGTQVPGGVSLCSYKESKSITSSDIYASTVITKDEPNGKKFLGVSCGTNDAKAVTMTSTESKGKRTYKCSCDGTVNTGVSSMYCAIYYWECPT